MVGGGIYPQEDEAVKETIAAFEQGSGKQIELVFYEQAELPEKLKAALEAGQPPDFAFGTRVGKYITEWAFDDRLVNLTETVGFFSDLFDPDALAGSRWSTGRPGSGRCTRCRWAARPTTSTSGRASSSRRGSASGTSQRVGRFLVVLGDQVQPAVRRAMGRDDIWGVGLNMSAEAPDTQIQFLQFVAAYDADYVTRDGRLVIDDPEVRRRLIETMDAYTAFYRKGCTPPSSTAWDSNLDNNKAFLAQAVMIVLNDTLSIPNALKRERPEDYYKNTATIEWPLGPHGQAFPLFGAFYAAVVLKDGRNVETAKEFVRFLVGEGWLAHYLDFAGERLLPPMQKLREGPLWLDTSDPHRMAAVMQIASRPTQYEYTVVSGDWRHDLVWQELVWAKAIHRVAAEDISPEQAVDEAIARIKEILSE